MNSLKSLLALGGTLLPLALAAQGQINFSNVPDGTSKTVTFAETGEALGPGWWAQLWANKLDIDLQPVGTPTEFIGDGIFFGGIVEVDSIPSGESGFFQTAVWKGPADSLAQAQAEGLPWGWSNLFSAETGGASLPGSPPSPPPSLIGFEGFAVQVPSSDGIGDRVWNDLNRNGVQDLDEPGIGGVEIRFLDCQTNDVLATTSSDSNGSYSFPGSIPEASYLEVSIPTGFMVTAWQIGNDQALDSDLDPLTGRSQCIAIDCENEDTLCPGTNIDIGLIAIPALPPIPGSEPTSPIETPPTTGEDPSEPTVAISSIGVSGPGFWKRQIGAWPVDTITVGGVDYEKEQAIPLISNGSDKSLTMFRQVISAKLNLAAGAEGNCILETLALADDWLATNGPVPGQVRGNSDAWKQGAPLARALEEFNAGDACAPTQDESLTPVEVAVGFGGNNGEGKPQDFRIRVKGQPGRQFLLQKTSDFKTWEDVVVIDNAFGISEAIAEGAAADPNAFFRVVPERGPAKKPQPKKNKSGTFRQVQANQNVELEPIVYNGDLIVAGSKNTVTGQILDADRYTVIAGNLEVRGANNHISNLTVLGDVILRGNKNELANVDYQGELTQTGGPENNIF
ncbi:hypothetical protein N8611_00870 [bacterium]|jgi:hypothetical protein|nr:hypothetical protein [bacterium]